MIDPISHLKKVLVCKVIVSSELMILCVTVKVPCHSNLEFSVENQSLKTWVPKEEIVRTSLWLYGHCKCLYGTKTEWESSECSSERGVKIADSKFVVLKELFFYLVGLAFSKQSILLRVSLITAVVCRLAMNDFFNKMSFSSIRLAVNSKNGIKINFLC